MDNNPNVIDSLFTRTEHVLYITQAFEVVRENRTLFLHKGSWHRFKGYAFSSLNKLRDKYKEVLKEVEGFEEYHSISKKYSLREIRDEIKRRES